jgi:hypothetical protein
MANDNNPVIGKNMPLTEGYQPSSPLEKGYQPTVNISQPAPTSLPTTGSSTIQPNVANTVTNENGGGNHGKQ